ncbi:YadA-like family protein, partial [Providencia rettgeri]
GASAAAQVKQANNQALKLTREELEKGIEISKQEAIQAGASAAAQVKQANNQALKLTREELEKSIYNNKQEVIQAGNQAVNIMKKNVNDYTDTKFKELEKRISQNSKTINSGLASVIAMTNIPYTSHTNFSFGAGIGNYKNGKSVALGLQLKVTENTNFKTSLSWNNNKDNAVGFGLATGF